MHDLYNDIKNIMDKGGTPEITFDYINRVFGGAIHHHPMYFPLPGMPGPGDATEDFHQWLKVQGWKAVQDLQDGSKLKIMPSAGPGS